MSIPSRILVVSFALLVVSGLSPVPESAASEPSAAETALKSFPGASPLVIPAAAFNSSGIYPISTRFWLSSGHLTGVDPPGRGCVQAPAYLPDNVEITGFYASIIDNDSDTNFSIRLTRTSSTSPGPYLDVATILTSGSNPDVQSLSAPEILDPLVNLPQHSFYVSTCLFTASTALISARVYYEASDMIFSDGFEDGGTSAWAGVTR